MSALITSKPRFLQITSAAIRRRERILPFSKDIGDKRSVLPTDPGVKPFSDIPGPLALPIFGTIFHYALGVYKADEPFESYSKMLKQYGPLVKETLFHGHTLVHVFNSKDLKEIHRSEKRPSFNPVRISHTAIGAYRASRKDLYAHIGVASSNGIEWRDYRTKMGMFPGHYDPHAKGKVFEQIADDLVEYMKSHLDYNGEIPLLPALYYYTLECMGVVCLGMRMGCFDEVRKADVNRFIQAVHETHYGIHKTELRPLILVRKEYRTLVIAQDYIADFVLKHMNAMKEKLELASIKNTDPFEETVKGKDDLVVEEDESSLVRPSQCLVYKKLKDGMTPRMILPMAADFFQGGIHSTAHSLTFALYHLALNPDVQEALRGKILEEDPMLDSFLELVIKETLRLNPPAIGTGRVLPEDLVLSGYVVPKGTNVILHHEIAAKQEENFPQPLMFLPERMLRLNEAQRYSYKPFVESSQRTCLGASIAHKEMKAALKKILTEFRLTFNYKRVGVKNYLLNEPDRPVKMRLHKISG